MESRACRSCQRRLTAAQKRAWVQQSTTLLCFLSEARYMDTCKYRTSCLSVSTATIKSGPNMLQMPHGHTQATDSQLLQWSLRHSAANTVLVPQLATYLQHHAVLMHRSVPGTGTAKG
jgi:hypothetical protein